MSSKDDHKSAQDDQAPEAIVHGAGTEKTNHPAHADKVAPMPEIEKGEAIEGLGGSGGGSSVTSSGHNAGQGGGKDSN